MENKKPDFRIKEKMLVVVNHDWDRTYIASIHPRREQDGRKKYAATCEMNGYSIISVAENKPRLSMGMDELATIIEEYTSTKLPYGIPLVMDIICCLN